MKSISKILASSALLLLAGNLFAEPACPPKSTVENAQFTRAFPADPMNSDIWGMITENFEFDGKSWNIGFAANLKDVKTPEEALRQGQTYFKTISFNTPRVVEWDNQLECVYTFSENNYIIVAGSPPLTPPDSMKKFLK